LPEQRARRTTYNAAGNRLSATTNPHAGKKVMRATTKGAFEQQWGSGLTSQVDAPGCADQLGDPKRTRAK
jgi:hypothetical protein